MQPPSKYAMRARQAQTTDVVWGGVLALGLPLLTFLVVSVLDVSGSGKRRLASGAFQEKEKLPPPPMSRELAQDIIQELQRLYEQNYQGLFVARFQRDELTAHDRMREFSCAKEVLSKCDMVLLKRLVEARDAPDSQIQSLAPTITRWETEMQAARQKLDAMDPRPEALRGPVSGGAVD